MARSSTAISICLMAMFTSSGFAQSVATDEDLKNCARLTDQDARLACFDDLGKRVLGEELADEKPSQDEKVEPEAATEPATTTRPLPADLRALENARYSVQITSCQEGQRGGWYFIFDNGQIWKEVNNRNLRFKECDFQATIWKDVFGYKMQIEGEDRTIRVRRHR